MFILCVIWIWWSAYRTVSHIIHYTYSQQSTITDAKEIVGRPPSSSSSNSSQQTASIIVVTAAMTTTSMTPSMNVSTRPTGKHFESILRQFCTKYTILRFLFDCFIVFSYGKCISNEYHFKCHSKCNSSFIVNDLECYRSCNHFDAS